MGFFGFGAKEPREKPLIVHVDDDKGILDIIQLALTGLGLEVLSFTDSVGKPANRPTVIPKRLERTFVFLQPFEDGESLEREHQGFDGLDA